ncbi:MAG: hypothetical protein WC683_10055 [bacterium]
MSDKKMTEVFEVDVQDENWGLVERVTVLAYDAADAILTKSVKRAVKRADGGWVSGVRHVCTVEVR